MRLRPCLMRALLAVGLLSSLFALLVPAGRALGQVQASWASIGPRSPLVTSSISAASGWAENGTMIVMRYDDTAKSPLVRSRDGGATWQPIVFPSNVTVSAGGWTERPPAGPIVFLGTSVAQRGSSPPIVTLYRSADDGDTWEKFWEAGTTSVKLLYSPDFANDNLVYLKELTDLLRSRDGGKTWETLAKGYDDGVDGFAISPTYAADQKIVLSGIWARSNPAAPEFRTPRAPGIGSGLQLSSDGGVTWSPLSTPTRDGIVYPRAYTIVLSPSFAEDGTLFVFASQLPPLVTTSPEQMGFRSTDRGQTWEPLPVDARDIGAVALSPTFATDRTIISSRFHNEVDSGRPDGRCGVVRSSDAGTTWDGVRDVNVGFSCARLGFWQGPTGIVAMVGSAISTDLGQSWKQLILPDGTLPRVASASPDFLHDGTIFTVTEKHGVWIYGPGVQSAAGRLACTIPLADGLDPVFDGDPWPGENLGCPKDAGLSTRIAELYDTATNGDARRTLKPDQGPRFALRTRPDGELSWSRPVGVPSPPIDAPTRVMQGSYQTFENGFALVLPGQDSAPREAVLLTGSLVGSWRVFESP